MISVPRAEGMINDRDHKARALGIEKVGMDSWAVGTGWIQKGMTKKRALKQATLGQRRDFRPKP